MKTWNEGDTCEVVCHECGKLVSATLRYRDVGFEDNPVIVRNLLVDVCDLCDAVVAVPAQATPQIRSALFEAHEMARGVLAVALGLPDGKIRIDLPLHPTAKSKLDIDLPTGPAQATFSPSEGYGLFSGSPTFAEREALFVRDPEMAAVRLKAEVTTG
jgi:hypothetical protein